MSSKKRSKRVDAPLPPLSDGSFDWRYAGECDPSRVHATVHEMMRDRGYSEPEPPNVGHVDDALCAFRALRDDRPLYAWAIRRGVKMGIKQLREVQEVSEQSGGASGADVVIISEMEATPAAGNATGEAEDPAPELFLLKAVYFNRTRHEMQPRFRRLTDAEAGEVADKYMVAEDAWAIMRRSDPVARYFGWPAGTVVECTRRFSNTVYYRKVAP